MHNDTDYQRERCLDCGQDMPEEVSGIVISWGPIPGDPNHLQPTEIFNPITGKRYTKWGY